MKNILKKIVALSIATYVVAATALLGACKDTGGGNGNGGHIDPTKSGYVITVLYPDGTPVKGSDAPSSRNKVAVQLVDETQQDDDKKYIDASYAEVNEYGKAAMSYRISREYLIDLLHCPRGYSYTEKVHTVAGRGDYTITLSNTLVNYNVNVTLPEGVPANGVTVTFKKDGTTVKSATTGADGKAVISEVNAGVYDVELANLPAGYICLPTRTSSGVATLNIELFKLNDLTFDTVMTPEKLQEWDDLANFYASDGSPSLIRFDKTAECYDFTTATIPVGKKVYYCFTADEEGEYRFIAKGKYYNVEFYGSTLGEAQNSISSVHESSNSCEMIPLVLKEGEKCYFSYSIPARAEGANPPDEHELSGTREFMIAKPVVTAKTHEISAPGNHTLTFNLDTAVLAYKVPASATPENPSPTDGGIFEIRSNTNLYDVKIEYYAYFAENSKPDEVVDDISETDKNFLYTLEVPPSYAGNVYYFKVKIKSRLDGGEVVYPTEVPITITRTGNAEDNYSPVSDKHATATEKYPDQSGKTFRFLLSSGDKTINESDYQIVNKNGGYYVVINEVEYELVVAITKNIGALPYSYATIEYMGGGDAGPSEGGDSGTGSGDEELPATPSATRQNKKLTLYTDPSVGEDRTNPKYDYAPFIEEYAELCNSDGVYALNDELKEFVQKYYVQHSQDFIFGLDIEQGCWLISCGYYA